MDDVLKKIREKYIKGYHNMEYAEICGQDLFLRHQEGEIENLGNLIDDGEVENLSPQAVIDFLNQLSEAYTELKYYKKHVDEKEVLQLYE